jgi:glutathione S-transferase
MIRVYNFARGARGLRVFWQCEEMGLPYQVEKFGFPPSKAFLALHPLGSVPFLEDDGGIAIGESIAIMFYLAHTYGPTSLLPPAGDAAFARVVELTVFGETALGMNMNPLLAAHFMAPEADKSNWSVRGQEARVEQTLGYLVQRLGSHAYLVGDDFTLADISVSCALGLWKGALGKPLGPELEAYRSRLAARPAYERARAQGS